MRGVDDWPACAGKSRAGASLPRSFTPRISARLGGTPRYAISLAQEFQAHLTLLHVVAEEKPGDLVHAAELVGSAGRLLSKLVPPEAEMWCVPHFAVECGLVAETILEVAKQRKADLLVLGVRQPSGFPGAATHLPVATAHKWSLARSARFLRCAADRRGKIRSGRVKKCIITHSSLTTPWRLMRELQFTPRGCRISRSPLGYPYLRSAIRFAMEDEKRGGGFVPADSSRGRTTDGGVSQDSFGAKRLSALSPAESLRMRVAHERLIRRCCIDDAHEAALVAVRTMPETGQDEILAVGRLIKLPSGDKAEVAVLVSDSYQRHGLGSELLRRLIQVAHDRDMQEIIANFLPENTGMRALANRFGFQFRPSSDPTVLKTVLNLTNAQALLSLRRYAGRHLCG